MLDTAFQTIAAMPGDSRHNYTPAQLAEANINPETLLATDYLNHFNEIIMLFELLPAMPECLEDIQAWQPVTYQEHFSNSAFQGRELAIAAYEHVAAPIRARFEAATQALNDSILRQAEDVAKAIANNDTGWLEMLCNESVRVFSPLLDDLNSIIHGSMTATDTSEHTDFQPDHDQAQAEIDALFD
jgi:hypothetical protein